jgi:hypothetical protein
MVDPRHLALIHAEIDGELDARQRAELSRVVLADPETRALREQFRALGRALDGLESVEPPARLREDIFAALPQVPARSANRAWPLPRWRFAAVLAGVLLTGTLVFRLMDSQESPASEMAGTLAAPRAALTADMVQLGQGPVSGRVSLVRDGDRLKLLMELAAGSPVDVLVAGEGRSFRVAGLHFLAGRAEPTTVALPGFGNNGQAVSLTFFIGGQEVGRAVLREPRGQSEIN